MAGDVYVYGLDGGDGFMVVSLSLGFPGSSDGKESAYNEGDPGLIPGPGRSPGEGNGNLLQYSCLENHMDRRAEKSWTWLSN